MYTSLLVAALTLAAPQAQDTVIRVDRGARLDVATFRGEVLIDVWDRSEVRILSDLDDRQVLDAALTGSIVRVRTRTRNGGSRDADFRITVPRWMDVRVEGNQVDVEVRGTEGEVGVETVAGDIEVTGGRGLVSVRSIQGDVVLRGARGNVEALSVNEDVSLYDIEGDIYVEATNGDITLREIRSSRARATTVNGDIVYEGSIREDGRYAFATHNGDIRVSVSEDADVTVSVSTFHGEFEAEFPVRLTGATRDRRFTFTLGSGRAQLELESFNGEIIMQRPR